MTQALEIVTSAMSLAKRTGFVSQVPPGRGSDAPGRGRLLRASRYWVVGGDVVITGGGSAGELAGGAGTGAGVGAGDGPGAGVALALRLPAARARRMSRTWGRRSAVAGRLARRLASS